MEVAHRFRILIHLLLGLGLSASAFAQATTDGSKDPNETFVQHLGYPQDWSSRQLILTGNDSTTALKAGMIEPRHVYNMVRRRAALEQAKNYKKPRKNTIKVDWSVSLENGYVPANQSPAKYGYDVTVESCTNDFLVYGLTVTSGTQANLVGINNLYTNASPACNGGTPWVAFAYNTVTQTGGKITTSPAISEFGGKVAFVETAATGSYFHVLVLPSPIPAPPSQTGTVLSPSTPTSCSSPTTSNCMTTVQISGFGSPTSPWIDYATDTAYVGTGDGKLYKISPVFGGGTPVVAADTNWPVTVITSGSSKILTAPTVDDSAGRIFIGDGNGYLYAVNLTAPAKTTAAQLTIGWVADPNQSDTGRGVADPPIIVNDSAYPSIDQVFSFTGCSNVLGVGGAINQVPANFTSSSTYMSVNLGSASGDGDCTGLDVHDGDFDNAFWTNGSTNGHITGCGFVNNGGAPSNPTIYMFPFINGQLNDSNGDYTNSPTTSWVVDNTKGDNCSPLTEFFDGTTDRLFFGAGGSTDGFIKSSSITAGLPASSTCTSGSPTSTCVTAPSSLGGTSDVVVDNQVANGGANIYFSTLAPGSVNGQSCHVSGGTASPYCAVKLTQSALQ